MNDMFFSMVRVFVVVVVELGLFLAIGTVGRRRRVTLTGTL
jgi:hypothetical protein